jgi:Tannase-like family of unknown function (DUF6351)
MKLTAAIAIAITMGAVPVGAQPPKGGDFEVTTLSARADMVSGGDVLIRIVVPASARTNEVVITVNGHAANAVSKPITPARTLIARIKDLQLGKNTIAVGLQGQKPAAQLAVAVHPPDIWLSY